MNTPTHCLLAIFVCILPLDGYAFPEIPFCPAGGPPGWFNHFSQNHEQHLWRIQQPPYQYNRMPRNTGNFYVYPYKQYLKPTANTTTTPDYNINPYIPTRYK